MATQRRSLHDSAGGTALADRQRDSATGHAATSVMSPGIVLQGSRTGDASDMRPVYDATKRAFDVAVSLLTIIAAMPLMAAIALLIKLDTPGPVFFRQERLGKGTRRFVMLKFRSMRTDSDYIPPELANRNEQTGPLFKMKKDPRITRIGRILRRTSLDELPQIFNVLMGQMSVVGPRPPLPRELDGFENIQSQRLQVKPGLAGLWQVSGRSNLTFDEMVRLDLEYIERRSFFFDVKLILQTVPAVLLGRGAY